MYKSLLLLIILSFTCYNTLLAKEEILLLKIGEKNTVLKLNIQNLQTDTIYQSEWDDIKKLKVSPTQKYISFIESKKGKVVDREYLLLPQNQLRIMDNTGNTLAVIKENVQEYIWSPDGEKLALIVGDYYEGGIGFFPEAFMIFDLKYNKLKKINLEYVPYQIHWSFRGNYIYGKITRFIKNKNVIRINLDTQSLNWTNFKDIWFSPDEKYYVHFPDQIDYNFRLYESVTNNEITKIILSGIGVPIRWISSKNNYFLFLKTKSEKTKKKVGAFEVITKKEIKCIEYTIFNGDKRNIIKRITDVKPLDFICYDLFVIFKKNGKIIFEEF